MNITQAARDAAADLVAAQGQMTASYVEAIRKGCYDEHIDAQAFQRVIDAERERCAKVAHTPNPYMDVHPDSPFYGFGAPRNDFERGIERGRELAAAAILKGTV